VTPVEVVLSKLPHARRSGDSWRAACPAHDGSRPDSLKVREGRDHEALLYCFAGCPLRDVVSAMGLEMRDLFVRRRRLEARTETKARTTPSRVRRLPRNVTDASGRSSGKLRSCWQGFRSSWRARTGGKTGIISPHGGTLGSSS